MNNRIDPRDLKPTPFFFTDRNVGEMAYIYPDTKHWMAGWLLRKTRGGEWITYRKATDDDIPVLSKAVIEAHHDVG